MSLQEDILDYGRRARLAARSLAQLSTTRKNDALLAMADEIIARAKVILAANEKDLVEARSSGLSEAMIDRLQLDRQRLGEMARGVRQVAALPDPVGQVIRDWTSLTDFGLQKCEFPSAWWGSSTSRAPT